MRPRCCVSPVATIIASESFIPTETSLPLWQRFSLTALSFVIRSRGQIVERGDGRVDSFLYSLQACRSSCAVSLRETLSFNPYIYLYICSFDFTRSCYKLNTHIRAYMHYRLRTSNSLSFE